MGGRPGLRSLSIMSIRVRSTRLDVATFFVREANLYVFGSPRPPSQKPSTRHRDGRNSHVRNPFHSSHALSTCVDSPIFFVCATQIHDDLPVRSVSKLKEQQRRPSARTIRDGSQGSEASPLGSWTASPSLFALVHRGRRDDLLPHTGIFFCPDFTCINEKRAPNPNRFPCPGSLGSEISGPRRRPSSAFSPPIGLYFFYRQHDSQFMIPPIACLSSSLRFSLAVRPPRSSMH
ncbi:hypothetical protein EDB81DRAFT_460607 [Dactylonectria macrodidyma]|uniref:Uncharacterized protein n=1 Tax=Dactylonectria macrodidyma TaxID=307937 RepID=A0A9P9J9P6_9HYPO|nr:hypothetical protein EDB81DRAFT_460607 [Dactylonectria macrodidyma]